MTAGDLDRAIRVIRARCSDAIAPGVLDLVEAALTGDGPDAISREVAELVVEVIDAMSERLDRIEQAA